MKYKSKIARELFGIRRMMARYNKKVDKPPYELQPFEQQEYMKGLTKLELMIEVYEELHKIWSDCPLTKFGAVKFRARTGYFMSEIKTALKKKTHHFDRSILKAKRKLKTRISKEVFPISKHKMGDTEKIGKSEDVIKSLRMYWEGQNE